MQPPSSQLNGGASVTNGHDDLQLRCQPDGAWGGGNYFVGFTNNRLSTNNLFANFNPSYTATLTAPYTQPIIRGFKIDNTRQQLAGVVDQSGNLRESVKATVVQTVANVRNAYWDLVFARSAVDVARRALALADRLVRRQPGARGSRHAGAARHRAGAGRSRHAPADAGRGGSHGLDRRISP